MDLSLGILALGTYILGSVTLDLSLGFYRFRTFAWKLPLPISFRLLTVAWGSLAGAGERVAEDGGPDGTSPMEPWAG